jgi:hypothetical protein
MEPVNAAVEGWTPRPERGRGAEPTAAELEALGEAGLGPSFYTPD